MKRYLFPMLMALVLAQPAVAAPKGGIAAVVNDSAITLTDVRDRAVLYISSGGQKATPEQIGKMEQQVLDKLIDEALQMQQAKKLGIAVRDADIDAAFAQIAQQNNMQPDAFRKRIKEAGVNIGTLYDQIRADIAWSHVVRRTLRPQVNISESEIDLTLRQMQSGSGKPQYRVAEIFIAVPDASAEGNVRQTVQAIINELKNGTPFSALARQYSQAPGAAGGGDLGWMQPGLLDPALDTALEKMQPGQISPPVRTEKGYHLLFLRDMKRGTAAMADAVVTVKQILIPLTAKDSRDVVAAKAARLKALQADTTSCDAMDAQMKKFKSPGTADLGQRRLSGLAPELREVVADLDVNALSDPFRTGAGLAVVMVCAREEAPAQDNAHDPAREQIATQLGMQRLDQMAQRFLRDLRETAFIDKRI